MSGHIPTCPWCGLDDHALVVNDSHGRFYCSCGSLFWGTDAEWRRLEHHRQRAINSRNQRAEQLRARNIPIALDY